MTGAVAKQGENRVDRAAARRTGLVEAGSRDIGMAHVSQEHIRHVLRREDMVGEVCLDRAQRHGVEARGGGVLHQDAAALGLDLLQSFGPVAAGPRQDDADRPFAPMPRQRLEEAVDRVAGAAPFGRLGQPQVSVVDGQRSRRRDDVDVVGLDRHAVSGLGHGHGAVLPQELREPALTRRVQMHHDQEGHATVGRHRLEQADQRLDPAGGGADSDDRAQDLRSSGSRFGRSVLDPSAELRLVDTLGRCPLQEGSSSSWSVISHPVRRPILR